MIYEISIFHGAEWLHYLTNHADGNMIFKKAEDLNAECFSVSRHDVPLVLAQDITGDYEVRQYWKDHYQEILDYESKQENDSDNR